MDEREKVTEFQAHRQCVSSCQFSCHDAVIITASHDATIALWDAGSGKNLDIFLGHSDRVVSCKGDEQQQRLLSASWDKSVALWDMNSPQDSMIWRGYQDSLLMSCDLCPLNQLAAASADSGYSYVWDIRSGNQIRKIKGHTGTVMNCKFDSSGNHFSTCSMDCTTIVWDSRMWRSLLKLSGHINVVSSCVFSHNSHWLATTSWDKTLRLYDIATGTYRSQGPVLLSQHNGCVSSCDFAADDSLLVSVAYDMNVNIWCMNSHQLKNTYKGHQSWIQDVHFGENRKWIVTCAKDGVVRVWNTEAGKEEYQKGQPMTVGISVVKCQKCGRMFSPAATTCTASELVHCVLCRLNPQLINR